MTDNNKKLNDAEMTQVTGETADNEQIANSFDEYGTIGTYLGNTIYAVTLDNKRVVTAKYPYRTVLDLGTRVGLFAEQSDIADYLSKR